MKVIRGYKDNEGEWRVGAYDGDRLIEEVDVHSQFSKAEAKKYLIDKYMRNHEV